MTPSSCMRAVMVAHPGGPEVLEMATLPLPAPAPGEVRVRVHAFGINRADLLQRRGLYSAPAGVPPTIPGLEYAGEVDAIGGEDGAEVAVGDRVMGIVGGGAYAEYLVTHVAHLLRIPDALSATDAAAVPEAFITAHDALERLGVERGEWVLVHAVGSGVGTAALQLIGCRGARCIGTSRTPAKLDRAGSLGLEWKIDTTVDDWVSQVKRLTGDGAHAAIDLIGGGLFPATLEALAPRGRLILVGITAGRRADIDLSVVLRRRLRIEGTVLRSRSVEEKTAVVRSVRDAVLPLLARGSIRPVIDRIVPFADVREAHAFMESNANFGKIVVQVA